ncbi:unnamed protein product [Rotaria sp. Silwood2]|nr:unnamed protein product [Rotaria sp. Silwood2]CAF2875295.1 unnamed protein product [Rotaria sp. Silwood2]CAF3245604.1 unnamed protein product [Rotaria sp. Silwood2]CAF4039514.1 unnamed protein product [Rotaria sp. Silwood2]CAF4175485.1 unnamed protein product [Rotaria sp. Silwood2]
MKNNNKQLENSESSKYLQGCPLLVPLLDARANEYWLFHGSDSKILPTLLKTGYDPRVSNVDGMFGGGFYLAENSSKSNQYIPCPGCAQNCILREPQCKCNNQEDFEFSIILYRTILGDVHIVKQYKKDIYRGIDKHHPVRRPPKKQNLEELYDSVMGECKKYGGDRLNYREFIIYDGGQAYPEYEETIRFVKELHTYPEMPTKGAANTRFGKKLVSMFTMAKPPLNQVSDLSVVKNQSLTSDGKEYILHASIVRSSQLR